jgi:hypothetical protein
MLKSFEVAMTITPPPFLRQPAFDVTYEVVTWDEELAEERAVTYAKRAYNVWREHITVKQVTQA